MPNRTYVEMMVDLVDRGKTIMPKHVYNECEKMCYALYKKPELAEQVVQTRIKIFKELNKYDGYHRLMNYQKLIIDYAILCKLLNRPCYVTMPFRAGKGIFDKVIMNMWYGDMMMKEFGNTDRTGMAFSTKEEIDEAYQHYMEMNFGNESRPEFLTKHMNIPVEEESDD